MRLLFAILACVVLLGVTSSQTMSNPEEAIQEAIETGIWDGHFQKITGTMGDSAAVTVTKVVAGRNLTPSQIDSVLVILNSSFADPRFVGVVSDRQPRTTLFVLQYLDSLVKDPELKRRITKTRTYVREQFAKLAQDSSGR